uniref:TGF_beta domain-containing protein n=2 Tax=Beroe forskalii TaxID=140453 RepID=V9PPL2_BERFR|nr:TGF_beta domain-containing protein [Beroe forskalii]
MLWCFILYCLQSVLGSDEQELFQRLGIPGPPKGQGRKSEPSTFMMELYKQHNRVLGQGMATSVSSFPPLENSSGEEISDNRWRFSFGISDIDSMERIIQSRLRVYKSKGSKQKETQYRVNVFHVVEAELILKTSRSMEYLISPYNSSMMVKLLDTQKLESRQNHWVSFDVADAIRAHQEFYGASNIIVFEVMCTPVNPIDVAASSRGIRFTKSRGKQSTLIVYSDDGSNDVEEDGRDARNSASSKDRGYDPSQTYCQRRELFIDFSRLGWDWIIGPPGFDAFMCSGECTLNFSAKQKITNHAYLQSYMESKHKNIPKPCCSPTKLSPLTLIYYTNDGVKMKAYQQMRVEECGCE